MSLDRQVPFKAYLVPSNCSSSAIYFVNNSTAYKKLIHMVRLFKKYGSGSLIVRFTLFGQSDKKM